MYVCINVSQRHNLIFSIKEISTMSNDWYAFNHRHTCLTKKSTLREITFCLVEQTPPARHKPYQVEQNRARQPVTKEFLSSASTSRPITHRGHSIFHRPHQNSISRMPRSCAEETTSALNSHCSISQS